MLVSTSPCLPPQSWRGTWLATPPTSTSEVISTLHKGSHALQNNPAVLCHALCQYFMVSPNRMVTCHSFRLWLSLLGSLYTTAGLTTTPISSSEVISGLQESAYMPSDLEVLPNFKSYVGVKAVNHGVGPDHDLQEQLNDIVPASALLGFSRLVLFTSVKCGSVQKRSHHA